MAGYSNLAGNQSRHATLWLHGSAFDLCTLGGVIHGGALMAFADTLGAIATLLNLPADARTTTIESKTNFIGGAEIGAVVIGEAVPIHKGRTTVVWVGFSPLQSCIVNESLLVIVLEGRLVESVAEKETVLVEVFG